jgi:hypothetical protein
MDTQEFSLKEFLENVPPGKEVNLKGVIKDSNNNSSLIVQDLQLHCSSEYCGGVRVFDVIDYKSFVHLDTEKGRDEFLTFKCKNCEETFKTYAFRTYFNKDQFQWKAYKYGEYPPFGLLIPRKALKLIEEDKNLFFMGRKCENQGMGIGAFVYYRRVVENQKNRIFDEIINAIKVISPGDELVTELEAAKSETQFSKAVESIKHGLPQSLQINGHNPLLLLHSALSEGVHAKDDDTCLELATSIRVVLVEFAERLGQALKDEAELTEAVKRLANKRNKSSS